MELSPRDDSDGIVPKLSSTSSTVKRKAKSKAKPKGAVPKAPKAPPKMWDLYGEKSE